MWSSNHFLYPAVSHIFQNPDFLGSRFFMVQVSQGLGVSGSNFYRVRVQGPGPGFRSSLKLTCWPLNFVLIKLFYKTKRCLELVALVLNFIKWLNFLAWLPSLLDILGNKCAITCLLYLFPTVWRQKVWN